jgi:hypothetical protein
MKRSVLIILALIVIGVAWYLFRPERIFINQTVNEEFPAATSSESAKSGDSATVLVSGNFHGVAHETKGIATIYELPGGQKILRFGEFETSNGPDVQVYLVAAEDANDSETVTKAGFIHIGALKGNIGDQNYELPSDVDLNKYKAVTVWCRRFGVNFGTAPLAPTPNKGMSSAAN